jgi:hypothetical protein
MDGRPLPCVIAAPGDGDRQQVLGGDIECGQDRIAQRSVGMVEGQFQLGQTQHAFLC